MPSREDRAWSDGFDRACRIAEEKGVEELLKERRFRVLTGLQARITSTELDRYDEDVKDVLFATLRIAYVAILYDEFGFRGKRIARFLDGAEKISAYLSKGWLYWIDMVEEIRARIGENLEIADGANRMTVYQRPENCDLYSDVDLIDKDAWNERLKFLGLIDDGKQVTDRNGLWSWKYSNPYDKIQIYDELGGIVLAVQCLGASKPGTEEQ